MDQHDWLPLEILGLSLLGLKPYSLHSFITVYKLAKSAPFYTNVILHSANLRHRAWGGEGRARLCPSCSSQPVGSHAHCFSVWSSGSASRSLVYNKCYGSHSSLPRSQNTINHPEQSPASCNKKVLKPQKGEPEEVPPESRHISITQWRKQALPSIKRVLTSPPFEASQIS